MLPTRFKSIPWGLVHEAGADGESLADLGKGFLLDGNFGAADLLIASAEKSGLAEAALLRSRLQIEMESNPQLARWGAWDPFLDAALRELPLERYSSEPGVVGVMLAREARTSVAGLLENSRNPMVKLLLESGAHSTYRRLFPVSSVSGRPLEVTLLGLALFAQGEHLGAGLKRDLQAALWEAKASGDAGACEEIYLDALSLMRLFDWGQLKPLLERCDSAETLRRWRYLFHRKGDQVPLAYAMVLSADKNEDLLAYLGRFGDSGFSSLSASLAAGLDGFRLVAREGLPIERDEEWRQESAVARFQQALAPFCLRNPDLALASRFGAFFLGAFLAFWGGSMFRLFFKEQVSRPLAYTQRLFGSLASVLVLVVLSEPYLSSGATLEGYSFKFVMPVLAQVDGELQVVETTPETTSMEPATILSISFFFLLQVLVFLICMLKVREIERRELDPLVKLKLMENEDNLFDSGLYVGIAGTCISLVLQVIGLVEANLLAAYSSNLFGILSVAIVKIRLVRPYKTKLIMASQDRLQALAADKA